jgi:hypothetical protein
MAQWVESGSTASSGRPRAGRHRREGSTAPRRPATAGIAPTPAAAARSHADRTVPAGYFNGSRAGEPGRARIVELAQTAERSGSIDLDREHVLSSGRASRSPSAAAVVASAARAARRDRHDRPQPSTTAMTAKPPRRSRDQWWADPGCRFQDNRPVRPEVPRTGWVAGENRSSGGRPGGLAGFSRSQGITRAWRPDEQPARRPGARPAALPRGHGENTLRLAALLREPTSRLPRSGPGPARVFGRCAEITVTKTVE